MAVIRNTSSQRRVGRVGSDTYYVANGQQIVRQAQNNSNYGESASRSYAQQKRRVRWANLVNFYKACSEWMPRAFEAKKSNQSDYNKFMSININNSEICLTKDMAQNDCCVIEALEVTQGSLSPITLTPNGDAYDLNIKIGDLTIGAKTTIAEFSQAIIDNNQSFENGDGISFVIFYGGKYKNGYPHMRSEYDEICLDVTNYSHLATLENMVYFDVDNDVLQIKDILDSQSEQWGIVAIHTRKSGKLQVSSQRLEVGDFAFAQEFSSRQWEEACIETYGVNDEVILTPTSIKTELLGYSVDDESHLQDYKGYFSLSCETGASIYFNVRYYDSLAFYIERNGVKSPVMVGDKHRYIDIDSSGVYNVVLNDVVIGKITAVEP